MTIETTASDPVAAQALSSVAHLTVGVDAALQHEIEQFLFFEARLLDAHRLDDWLELVTEDIHYWMPVRFNRLLREQHKEQSGPSDTATFDENKRSLRQRVVRINTQKAWSEDPPSRCRHIVSNVWARPADREGEYDVQSYFVVYRNRGDNEVDFWVGKRDDVLRKIGPGEWRIAQRKIVLDQTSIQSKNLTIFV